MLPILFAPPAAKTLFALSAPWLAGGAAAGFLLGRLGGESAANRRELERQRAALQKLARDNRRREEELAALRAAVPPAGQSPQAADKSLRNARAPASPDPRKGSLLKRLLDANLKLRKGSEHSENQESHS